MLLHIYSRIRGRHMLFSCQQFSGLYAQAFGSGFRVGTSPVTFLVVRQLSRSCFRDIKSMAVPEQHQLHAINQIAEALSSCERRRLLYLCGSLDTEHSVACVKETLKSKVLRQERGHLLLLELMLRLRRFDILRKVCKTNKDEVERTLTNGQCLPRFRVLMANISEDIANDDLNSVKFLLSSTLPREKVENAKNFLDVVIELEKLDKVSPERVDFVEECLRNISRVDLAKKVIRYKTSDSTSEQQSPQQHMFSSPRPVTSYGSYSPCQTSQVQSVHRVPQNKRVTSYREQSCQNQLDRYKFNTNPRGVCVVIDCVGNDGDMLEQTFKDLHFNVVLHKWLSVNAALSALRETLKHRENLGGDSFVCCIISRGTESHILGTDSNVAGLGLDSIRRMFTADSCCTLAGKPKLFFIQRYSVPEFQPCDRTQHRDEDLETDGMSSSEIIPTEADMFWSHCWTDERQLEEGHHSSVYLRALTEALHKGQRRETSLVDVHTEVNGAIFEHNRRNPGAAYHFDVKHTLRKDLYLQ